MKCPIKGHDHNLTLLRMIHGQGQVWTEWECPGGLYRWTQAGDEPLGQDNRHRRPPCGWPESRRAVAVALLAYGATTDITDEEFRQAMEDMTKEKN